MSRGFVITLGSRLSGPWPPCFASSPRPGTSGNAPVDADDAVSIVTAMATTIKGEWRTIGAKVGMTPADVKAIVPAIENTQIERALAIGS
jgi:hypothetical protein